MDLELALKTVDNAFDNWVDKIYHSAISYPTTIWCTRCLVLGEEMAPEQLDPYKDVRDITNHYSIGARLKFYDPETGKDVLGANWVDGDGTMKNNQGLVSCILGANYIGTTEWLKNIKSFAYCLIFSITLCASSSVILSAQTRSCNLFSNASFLYALKGLVV